MGISLERESWDRAVEVADDFWMIATRHRPGFAKMMPEINNRCLVFRLRDEKLGKPVLLVANGVDPVAIPEVRKIERSTGAEVRYVLSVGGGHHLMLPAWRDEFTYATVLVGPERIPRTPSAQRLMQGGRVSVLDAQDPLPQFRGQLEAVVFRGLLGLRDHQTTYEGGKEPTMLGMMKRMMSIDDPADELWLRHPSTETIVAGENLGWILSEKAMKAFPFMMRMMMKANSVYVQDKARKVGDAAQVAACWNEILAWPGRTLMGYHEPPGEAFVGDVQGAIAAAVSKVGQLKMPRVGAVA